MINSKRVAEVLSVLLAPSAVAFIATLIFTWLAPTAPVYFNPFLSMIIGILFLSVFPIGTVLYYYHKGKIDLWVSERKVRPPFYIIAIIGYIIASLLFYYLKYNWMFLLSVSYLCVTTVVLISNFFTKVSSHSAGVAGPVTALAYIFGVNAVPLFVFVPLVIWARLKTNAHTFAQLIAGAIIAVVVTFSVYFYFLPEYFVS